MSIGIYMIRNLSNNKVYIGQSTDINRRWNDHKMKLKNNIHYNEHLQKSYNKYGEKFFQYSILCETSKENLNELESYYIQKYQSDNSKYGYNQTLGGDCNIIFTKETIKKMRSSHEYEFVQILQYSLDKNLVARFNSLSEASRSINGTPSGVRNCANKFSLNIGKSKTYKGYIWIYEYDKDKLEQIDIDDYLSPQTSFPVNKYEYPSGKFICSYKSVLDAANDNNISIDVISMCVREVQKQSKGFTYRNANKINGKNNLKIIVQKRASKNQIPVVALDINTKQPVLYLKSMCSLKDKGFHSGHISQCCSGKRKTYRGYLWTYADEQFAQYFGEDGIKEVEKKSLSDM